MVAKPTGSTASVAVREAPTSLVPAGRVRMAPTMAIPALLRDFGVDPGPLVAAFGLRLEHFVDPEHLISYADRSRLLVRCVEATGCPHFALLLGQRAGLSSFGLLGFLMQSAPDFRAALAVVTGNFPLHNPNAVTEVHEEHGYLRIGHTILQHDFEGREQVVDLSGAIMLNVLRNLCGHGERPVEMWFARPRPADLRPYTSYFQVPLRFDARDTGPVLPVAWLDRPLPSADPLLHLMMRRRIAELAAQAGDGLASRLRRALPSLLASRRGSLVEVAERFGLSPRTLNRRLAADGTSFLELRDEARCAVARELLHGTAMPVGEIAEHLGYANASALTAAFRRWTGVAPAEWRAVRRRPSRSPLRGGRPG